MLARLALLGVASRRAGQASTSLVATNVALLRCAWDAPSTSAGASETRAAQRRGAASASDSSSSSSGHIPHLTRPSNDRPRAETTKWSLLHEQGHDVNPCNSKLHPAVVEGAVGVDAARSELAVQEAYTPESQCFGCGPASVDGMRLASFRAANGGLEARTTLAAKYQAFPGIINGGAISTLFDCHGNWSAAIALMDGSCLPRPPLTLTAELLVNFKEPTPPDQPLVLRSQIVKIKEAPAAGGRASVQVDLTLHLEKVDGTETLLAAGTGIFKKLGALRAL